MQSKEYIEKLVRAAILYYKSNLTQQEVAERMGTTRQAVCKYLSDAKEYGIVEINVNNPISETLSIEEELKRRFGLKAALVVPGSLKDDMVIRHEIARIATPHIIELMRSGIKNIALSWGRSIFDFIKNFPEGEFFSDINIFPVMGASNNAAPYYMINEMVRDLSEKIHGIPNFIYLPLNPESHEDYIHYTSTQLYRKTLKNWSEIDLLILGIGSRISADNMIRQSYPGEIEVMSKFDPHTIVGDVFTKYFDINGNFYSIPETEQLLTMPQELFAKVGRVVALAGGAEKAKCILGALRTGRITDFVTDEKAAKTILTLDAQQA
ncbi:MAG: hypothetical protein GX303_05010 [Clostridiales bacterium]|nr:hypothetical protein [Clostridiales bacterium]